MHAQVLELSPATTRRPGARQSLKSEAVPYGSIDPLGADRTSDPMQAFTTRQLGRLVFLATEVGARFEKEGSAIDAAAWMFKPRQLFGGLSAIEAARNRKLFLRAMVYHSLGLVTDGDPSEIDDVIEPEMEDRDRTFANGTAFDGFAPAGVKASSPRLMTATLVEESECGVRHLFHAVVTTDPAAACDLLRARIGGAAFEDACIRQGFDPSEPVALSLLSSALVDMLTGISEDPSSKLASGLDLFLEHRFDN